MKRLSRALLLALGLLVLASPPQPTRADEIPLVKAGSGTWEEFYAGQSFRITATAPVRIRFELVSPTEIKLTFISDTGQPGRVTVYWNQFLKYIYTGPIPQGLPWEGTLDTEGGFVDR
jgi:hypothetical protein